jgi:hypothetical protein
LQTAPAHSGASLSSRFSISSEQHKQRGFIPPHFYA